MILSCEEGEVVTAGNRIGSVRFGVAKRKARHGARLYAESRRLDALVIHGSFNLRVFVNIVQRALRITQRLDTGLNDPRQHCFRLNRSYIHGPILLRKLSAGTSGRRAAISETETWARGAKGRGGQTERDGGRSFARTE